MTAGLVLEGVAVTRNGLTTCRDVSLVAPPGEITVLLGANGAGKSTLLEGISGVLPTTGSILLDGDRIDRFDPHQRTALGLATVEPGRSVFSRLTVAQNLAVVDRSAQALEAAFDLFPRLAEKRGVPAGLLSGGEQQMLVIARALATRPRILLVDELSLGLGPRPVSALMNAVGQLLEAGTGVVLVEQLIDTALRVGTMAHIMHRGRIVRSDRCSVFREEGVAALASTVLGAPGCSAPDSRVSSTGAW